MNPSAPNSPGQALPPSATPLVAASLLRLFAIAVLMLGIQPSTTAATSESVPRLEYQVKAGYLFNFLRFTEWPPSHIAPGQSYRVGIVEDAAVARIVSEKLAGKEIDGHPVEVVLLPDADSAGGCHLVFIPRTAEQDGHAHTHHGVLTVGDAEGFALQGGIVGFVARGYNIRFQVNLDAASKAGLRLSSRLAALAEVVRTAPPP